MELRTILKRVYRLPRFVYGRFRLVWPGGGCERNRLEFEARPRANRGAQCSDCGKVDVERVTRADGNQRTAKVLDWFLAR